MNILKESWRENYFVHSYEIDQQSRLSLESAINFFQDSALRNAEVLGLGFKDLAVKDRFWVLSRLYVEMYRYPLLGDSIQLETWPKGMESLFAMRDFRIKSVDSNELLGAGCTAWLIIDGTTHRLQRVESVLSGEMPCYPHNATKHKFDKISLASTMTSHIRIVAGYTDVDINNHVNNVCYLKWAINYMPIDNKTLTVRSAEVNFLAEARLHSPIEILYGSDRGQVWICLIRNPDTGKEYCRIQLRIEKEQ